MENIIFTPCLFFTPEQLETDFEQKEILFEEDPADVIEKLHTRDDIEIGLAQLPIRERHIVELYIGWNGEAKNFQQIGKVLRISGGRVRQLFNRGIERLRRLLQKNGCI